jgi:hypothetical protein
VDDTAYFTVPFVQRVTVGIQAFAKAFMVQRALALLSLPTRSAKELRRVARQLDAFAKDVRALRSRRIT